MEKIIEIKVREATSRIVIGNLARRLEEYLPVKRVVIITDSNVHRHYREIIDGFDHIIIGIGETHKTIPTVEKVYRELLALEADRSIFLLGFGGGIVTDVTGFAASTYMRGVECGFVATTLMAQLDAAIGGKNGVNVDGYKNMAGTFAQPSFVLCDPCFLRTLPEREFRAGLAEALKAGIIADPELFRMLETATVEDLLKDDNKLVEVIYRSARVKADIVAVDEKEKGERRILNLGHTFAHAIEKYTTDYNHGEAVAAGISIACDIAVKTGIMPESESRHIKEAFRGLELNVDTPVDRKRILKELTADKKREGGSIHLVLPKHVGKCVVRQTAIEELDELVSDL